MKDKHLAIVALNGISRGVCNDFNVEEGWVQYLMPKDDAWYCRDNPTNEWEMRRYYGKVEVLAYVDLDGPNDQTMKFYNNIPEGTPLLPTERYEVRHWELPVR